MRVYAVSFFADASFQQPFRFFRAELNSAVVEIALLWLWQR